ncbi:MAG: family 10 glycosylhydrolase [Clostridia bacterium]|nr:family 10 glycosylhydrolase [Clostridia bacterium]
MFGKWIWGGTVADLGTDGAEIIASRCADEGITDLYLLVKGTGGKLSYLKTQYTDILSRKDRDVLQETIDAAHKRGIRVHAWICVMRDETYKANHNDAGVWQYVRGRDNKFITPYNEGYREYIGNVAKELAAYGIDGLHLDYFRYNHNANGWSSEDFERLAAMGADLERVKELIETTNGYNGRVEDQNYVLNAYRNNDPDAIIISKYRTKNIRELAEHIIKEAKTVNPNLIFSGATMPEGAYDSGYAGLNYGQSYDDAAKLYDYICPMAYSGTYGKPETWVVDVAEKAIAKGNRVVMGIQAFDEATSDRIMAETENLRELMRNPTYAKDMLGVAFFRSGTFDYAKATYDNANKRITVKIGNTGSSAYTKICVEGKNGIKFTNAAIGEGFDRNATASVASNGSSVVFEGDELLPVDKIGYLCLEYEGDIDPARLPLLVHIYRSSDEMRIYTAVWDANADNYN